MQFDAALAAQAAFHNAQSELGADWETAVALEEAFSSQAGSAAREAYEALLNLAQRYPGARSFQAFCVYMTWQHVTEETLACHFQTGLRLCEQYLSSLEGNLPTDVEQIRELRESFRAGLGMEEEDDLQVEFRRDTPKGGD
jgi:hypothetical protein